MPTLVKITFELTELELNGAYFERKNTYTLCIEATSNKYEGLEGKLRI